ncbi:hypothetical protein EDC30_102236 [Paucimonas lemoignei]|uniref:Uncharacterized protein n=1 Tax=Paucimonas lemoignei TaxID=29443 RepID=A0A4R3HYP8_PAULE|nr:hypothetical protein [Paucimonas lemoignei]TCS38497.1 hypothetical protein EDC30_102236 [Paucimonas lemoignei]
MSLPQIDFEMAYWRLRRRLQRIRAAWRAMVSRIRAQRDLEYLHRYGRMPEKLEPEETFAYRAMWAIAIAGLVFALSSEADVSIVVKAHADSLVVKPQDDEVPAVSAGCFSGRRDRT